MTLRSSCASCDLSSSTPAPEISETYPGTSGSTQGERNDTNPATKAAIGSGRVDIQKYCTCVLQCFANQCRPEGSLSLVTDSVSDIATVEKVAGIRDGYRHSGSRLGRRIDASP